MLTRRELLKRTAQLSAAAALPSGRLFGQAKDPAGVEVNDVQSQLNRTRVNRIVTPESLDAIQAALRDARSEGRAVSIAGGRHAMGGQQFGTDAILLDMKKFNRVVGFDRTKGHVEVEGGIEWPELIDYLWKEQAGQRRALGHPRKADRRGPRQPRRVAVVEHPRPRAALPAADRQRRVVRPGGRRRQGAAPVAGARTPSYSRWPSAATACSASSPG